MREKLLGVNIDYIQIDQAVETVKSWLQKRGKHYIVTPNPEIIVDAQADSEFKKALNEADLAISDSPRLGWASTYTSSNNPIFRLLSSPFFLIPGIIAGKTHPVTRGVDLMERLISLSQEKALITAYLGGSSEVADKLFKCLKEKYPKLKIAFCSGNIQVNEKGESRFDRENIKMTQSKEIKLNNSVIANEVKQSHFQKTEIATPVMQARNDVGGVRKFNIHSLTQKIDILFVAFGHKKQEKWMQKHLPKLNTRVMMGVGGAFDYISGSVPRAPLWLRSIGMEWLFRFLVQPWRIKRFWKLPYFIYLILTKN